MPYDPSNFDNGFACGSAGSRNGSYLYGYHSDGKRYMLVTALENPPASTDPNYYNQDLGCSHFANYWINNGY